MGLTRQVLRAYAKEAVRKNREARQEEPRPFKMPFSLAWRVARTMRYIECTSGMREEGLTSRLDRRKRRWSVRTVED